MARGGWWGFRIELTLAEVLAVVAGAIGSSLAIFLLGIWVGKGWEARQLKDEQQIVRLPVEPDLTAAPANPEQQMEFYDALIQPAASSATPAPEPSPLPTLARPRSTSTPAPMLRPTPKPKPPLSERELRGVPSGGGWSVQVLASKDRAVAQRLAQSLVEEGYRARVVELRTRGGTRYRVRVGSFPSFERATEAARRLRGHGGITEAFVASE